jgi:3-deoxy-D-manno-octulosonic-acid transferase
MILLSLYTLVLTVLCVALAPLLPLLLLVPRSRWGLGMRLGILPKAVREQAWLSEGSVWVHAASLGEVNAVAPVVRELMPKLPRQALVVTCTTQAGCQQAKRLFPQASACLLLPVDLPWLLAPWIRRFKPRLLVLAETELWPNLLLQMKAHGAQILVANGRLTERSFRRYRRLGRAFAALLESIDLFAMQADADAQRIQALGARPARVSVAGNTKFDLGLDPEAARIDAAQLRRALGWTAGAPVLVAGSTRPGEEAALLAAFAKLQKQLPTARLVLAPRHLERRAEVEALLKKGRWQWVRRSQAAPAKDADLLLLDTLGELRAFYGLAYDGGAAWIGGSFRDFGGQNPLEASAQGVPVFFGPSMRHFPDVAQALLDCGAARQVTEGELADATLALLKDSKARQAAAEAGEACVRGRSGAGRRTAELALKLLLVSRMHRDGQAWRGEGQDQFRKVTEFGSAGDPHGWDQADDGGVAIAREFGTGHEGGDGLG